MRGHVGQAGPDLLSADQPDIAIRYCLRRKAGQVRAGARFGEQLAPDLLVSQNRAEESLFLFIRTPTKNRPGRPCPLRQGW